MSIGNEMRGVFNTVASDINAIVDAGTSLANTAHNLWSQIGIATLTGVYSSGIRVANLTRDVFQNMAIRLGLADTVHATLTRNHRDRISHLSPEVLIEEYNRIYQNPEYHPLMFVPQDRA